MTKQFLVSRTPLIEYTDYRLQRCMGKTESYKESAKLLLKIPAEFRESAWIMAHNRTPNAPIEDHKVIYPGAGFNKGLEQIISEYLSTSE